MPNDVERLFMCLWPFTYLFGEMPIIIFCPLSDSVVHLITEL